MSLYRPPGGAIAVDVPLGSVLGLNYSGMHDTAIAIVAPDGEPVYAMSLERHSRRKQDGRPPHALLEGMPWQRIAKVAVSAEASYCRPESDDSRTHPLPLETPDCGDRSHGSAFQAVLAAIPVAVEFVPHHLSHAASSFWHSGFERATCLVYDGGMANEQWFGGVYAASRGDGLRVLDRFSAPRYANVAHLYSVLTALLGFTPMKHEGKLTGLAAYGRHNDVARQVLHEWLVRPRQLEGLVGWEQLYAAEQAPRVVVDLALRERLMARLADISREDLAATVQAMAEEQVAAIWRAVCAEGWQSEALCLSGGLFANVRINQRLSAASGRRLFVAPPMTDDGTAWGAALQLLSSQPGFAPRPLAHVYLGSRYRAGAEFLAAAGIVFSTPENAAASIARKLAAGQAVAVFQGAGEYGPRALGNRSILAAADRSDINSRLNARLDRTEFMPFAPIIRAEDAAEYFDIAPGEMHACRFMTLTVGCTERARRDCPAVVHVDGTARPQVLNDGDNALMRAVLSEYGGLSGRLALVNTSFNIHEEPIVCSPEDALRGFFEAGLDCLYLDGCMVELADNRAVEAQHLRRKLRQQGEALRELKARLPRTEHQLRDAQNMVLEEKHHAWLATQRAEQTAASLAALHGSTSWRITAPLRWLRAMLQRGGRN